MKRNVKVKVNYLRYGANEPKTLDFEPYCLKLFNKRWYVLAHFHRDAASNRDADDYYGIFAFDRIKELELTEVKFEVNPDFDAAEYFQENFGVLVHDGTPLERIVLRVYGQESYYLCDLPMHHSQREIGSGDDYIDIELMLRPTIDFTRHLMSLGSSVQVLIPYWLADEVHAMHIEAANLYKSMLVEENEG